MTYRERLQLWVREALGRLGGEAEIDDVAKDIWLHHEDDLRNLGRKFYSWQYDMRWAAQKLRENGQAALRRDGAKSVWLLKK